MEKNHVSKENPASLVGTGKKRVGRPRVEVKKGKLTLSLPVDVIASAHALKGPSISIRVEAFLRDEVKREGGK